MFFNFLNYKFNIKWNNNENIFLLINYSTRLNNEINENFDKNSKKINDIEKLIIDNVDHIENIDDICEKELLSLLLSNSRFFKYYKYVNNWNLIFWLKISIELNFLFMLIIIRNKFYEWKYINNNFSSSSLLLLFLFLFSNI